MLETHFLQSPLKKKNLQVAKERVKNKSECGEGQNFLGSYCLIKIRMERVEGEEGMSF